MSATNGRYKTKWIAAGKRDGVFEGRRDAEKSGREFGAYCLAQKLKILLEEIESNLNCWHLNKEKLTWKDGEQSAWTMQELAERFARADTIIQIAQDICAANIREAGI